MATKSGSMKGFYRQKKSTKSASNKKDVVNNKSPIIPSVMTEPTSFISSGYADIIDNHDDEHEEVLRQFDLNMAYGPCLGMSRLARWERAQKLGKNPPKEVETLLKRGKMGSYECLWEEGLI